MSASLHWGHFYFIMIKTISGMSLVESYQLLLIKTLFDDDYFNQVKNVVDQNEFYFTGAPYLRRIVYDVVQYHGKYGTTPDFSILFERLLNESKKLYNIDSRKGDFNDDYDYYNEIYEALKDIELTSAEKQEIINDYRKWREFCMLHHIANYIKDRLERYDKVTLVTNKEVMKYCLNKLTLIDNSDSNNILNLND